MSMMPIDEEQGLLGGMMMDPRSMGLLNLGAGLLQASGPSRMPIGLGQAIGMALPQGIQGMQQAYAMKQQQSRCTVATLWGGRVTPVFVPRAG